MNAPAPTLLLSRDWSTESERAFYLRQLAGAVSRQRPVAVAIPGTGSAHLDGLFEVIALGDAAPNALWPVRADGLDGADLVIVDADDTGAIELVRASAPDARIMAVGSAESTADAADLGPTDVVVTASAGLRARLGSDLKGVAAVHDVGCLVPINLLAAERRHNAIGSLDYLLVLTDRPGRPNPEPPTDLVAWLAARFPRQHLIVVEGGTASVWHTRSLRGVVGIHTRTDLWRLVAHAHVMVDLDPAPWIARECLEAMRFGTPILVPEHSLAAEYAREGGGRACADVADVFVGIEELDDPSVRQQVSSDAREIATAPLGGPGPARRPG